MSKNWPDSYEHMDTNAWTKIELSSRRWPPAPYRRSTSSAVDGTDVFKYYIGPRGLGHDSIGTTDYIYYWRDSNRFDNVDIALQRGVGSLQVTPGISTAHFQQIWKLQKC